MAIKYSCSNDATDGREENIYAATIKMDDRNKSVRIK
jgi:hypothetical protein